MVQITLGMTANQSDARIPNLVEYDQDAIIMSDPQGEVTYWNQAAERIFGYTAREMVGRNANMVLLAEADRARALAGGAGFALTGQGEAVGRTLELVALRKNGDAFPIAISVSGVRAGDGWNAIAIARDISERRPVDAAIRESEEKYRDLVESTTDCIWQIDATGRYTYVSPMICALTGYEPAEIVGKTPFDVMTLVDAQRAASEFANIAAKRAPFTQLEYTILTKAGTELVIETSGVPIYNDNGTFNGYRGIDRNITRRSLATKAMTYQSALLHAVADAAAELLGNSLIDDAVPKALEKVGEAVRAQRVVVMEPHPLPAEFPSLVVRYTWHADDAPVIVDQTSFSQDAPNGIELDPWFAPLSEGQHITATISTATGRIRDLFACFGVRSILAVPVMVDGRYRGHVSLHDCRKEREWTVAEVDILKTLAGLIGTAMTRARYVKELSDATMIVEHSPSILYRIRGEPALPMIYVSHNISMFGHDPAELLRNPELYKRLIHPDDADRVRESMAQVALPGSGSGVIEFRLRNHDGDYRWVHNRYNPIRDDTGRLIAIEGVLTDVTERKEAEEQNSSVGHDQFAYRSGQQEHVHRAVAADLRADQTWRTRVCGALSGSRPVQGHQ